MNKKEKALRKCIRSSLLLFIFGSITLFIGVKFTGMRLKGQINNPIGPYTWEEAVNVIPQTLLASLLISLFVFWMNWLEVKKMKD